MQGVNMHDPWLVSWITNDLGIRTHEDEWQKVD